MGDGVFPWDAGHRAHLAETRQIGDVVLLRYALSSRFEETLMTRGPSTAAPRRHRPP